MKKTSANKNVLSLRYVACIMWMVSGIMSLSIEGYISAAASLLFIAAMTLEIRG